MQAFIPNPKGIFSWHQLTKEKQAFTSGGSLCVLSTLKCRSHAEQQMARTNQTQCYFYRTCVSNCFVWACFCLISHYLYTTQFLILCFNELGVLCFSLLICLSVWFWGGLPVCLRGEIQNWVPVMLFSLKDIKCELRLPFFQR